MAVPWLQIVGLVPSILDVSRELLKRSKRFPEGSVAALAAAPGDSSSALAARIEVLEDNERRQAELLSQMAEQNAALARGVTILHARLIRLALATTVASLLAAIALGLALWR
jgi:hypothetical protein